MVTAFDVHDKQDFQLRAESENEVPLLAVDCRISPKGRNVEEHIERLDKGHAMLSEIRLCLGLVPFKVDVVGEPEHVHGRIVRDRGRRGCTMGSPARARSQSLLKGRSTPSTRRPWEACAFAIFSGSGS